MYAEVTPESARAMFAGYHSRYMETNPEPDFDRFTAAMLGLWLDRGPSGYPGQRVADIEAQALLIRGDGDFLTTPEATVALAKAMRNAAFLNVPFADHVVYEQQGAVCETVIRQFLATDGARAER